MLYESAPYHNHPKVKEMPLTSPNIRFKKCLLLFDAGQKGSLKQAQGLATLMGVFGNAVAIKRHILAKLFPFRKARMWGLRTNKGQLVRALSENTGGLVICSGKNASAAGALLKKQNPGLVVVSLMNPKMPLHHFDAVIAPAHDGLKGPNVINTRLSLHPLTDGLLKAEQKQCSGHLEPLSAPHIGVLIGGPAGGLLRKTWSRLYWRWLARKMGKDLQKLQAENGGTILLAPSRRTPAAFVKKLKRALKSTPYFLWEGKEGNPYGAILASADALIVTADSVQMLSEAAFSAAPLFSYPISGLSKRIRAFNQQLFKDNLAKPFHGRLQHWFRSRANEADTLRPRLAFLSTARPYPSSHEAKKTPPA